ncbi:hypothetical protein IAD21_02890 [Abditibacteriota bacterium]|nr:hypothetical protein IAD21_02890 [Abditibacteriota bacterium]
MSGTPLLIMSIFSLLCCQILGPVSWFMANNALKSGTVPAGDIGTTNAARIIGIIATVFLVLGIIRFIMNGGNLSYNVGTARPAPSLVVTIPADK